MPWVRVLRTFLDSDIGKRTRAGQILELSDQKIDDLTDRDNGPDLVRRVSPPSETASGPPDDSPDERRRSSADSAGAGDTDEPEPGDGDGGSEDEAGDEDDDLRFSMSPQGRRDMAEFLVQNRGVPEEDAEQKAKEIAKAQLFPGNGAAGRVLVGEVRDWIDSQG